MVDRAFYQDILGSHPRQDPHFQNLAAFLANHTPKGSFPFICSLKSFQDYPSNNKPTASAYKFALSQKLILV